MMCLQPGVGAPGFFSGGHMNITKTMAAVAAVFVVAGQPLCAGNLLAPEMEQEPIIEEAAASSAGGIVIPLLFLLLLAGAMGGGGGGGASTPPPK